MRRFIVLLLVILSLAGRSFAEENAKSPIPPGVIYSEKKILFMGDSITHAGHYISWIEAQLRTNNKQGPYATPIIPSRDRMCMSVSNGHSKRSSQTSSSRVTE
jgi:hypothetical protein